MWYEIFSSQNPPKQQSLMVYLGLWLICTSHGLNVKSLKQKSALRLFGLVEPAGGFKSRTPKEVDERSCTCAHGQHARVE